MIILAIETSCDDTAAAVMDGRRVLSSVISSQTDLHKEWGGVVPDIAKRAHTARIGAVIASALIRAKISITKHQDTNKSQIKNSNSQTKIKKIIGNGMESIEVIAVTQGPGLAIALGVGVNTAKELAREYGRKLVAVNHIEGHILSSLVENKYGKPERQLRCPALALTVSGGHSKIVLVREVGNYEVVGETLDDAAGEALDKAAKMMGLGYPGGPIIEQLALGGRSDFIKLAKPLADKKILDYSFSGLKTSFYYQIKDWPREKVMANVADLAATFQNGVFELLLRKYKLAIEKYKPVMLMASGGVMANRELRKRLRKLAREMKLPIIMPAKKWLNTDNAAMIGMAGYYKAMRGEYVKNIEELDREPRKKL